MKKFLEKLDPYHQSPFYFKWDLFDWFVILFISGFLFAHCHQMLLLVIFYNPIFSYPGVYIHSIFGHKLVGPILEQGMGATLTPLLQTPVPTKILGASAGFLTELILPVVALAWSLRLPGGRFLFPLALYWFSVCVFGIGNYMRDATVGLEEDMFPYVAMGDWNFIFESLGLLPYSKAIGSVVVFISIMCFVVAVWSFIYYWVHIREYDHRNGEYH